jgi:DNA polymerase-3 subunit epsilon
MQPSTGRILEIAWANASDAIVTSSLVKLESGESIPARVQEITGIVEKDMERAENEADVMAKLKQAVNLLGESPYGVIHYAQFEKSFLEDLQSRHESPLSLEVLCSQRIAKRLFPFLPSHNISGI